MEEKLIEHEDLHRPENTRRHDFATFAGLLSPENRIKITKIVLRHAPLIIQSVETVAASFVREIHCAEVLLIAERN